MMARRQVMGGSFLAGFAALLLPKSSDSASAEQRDSGDDAAAKAVDQLREVIERHVTGCELSECGTLGNLRNQLRVFMRANRKYPDFIDTGVDAWEDVYDWHIKNRQEPRTTRLPDGRYGILFMFTTVVLREDQTPSFVGWGYDAR